MMFPVTAFPPNPARPRAALPVSRDWGKREGFPRVCLLAFVCEAESVGGSVEQGELKLDLMLVLFERSQQRFSVLTAEG